MARAALRDIVFGLAATGLLMGCVEGGGKTGTGDGAGFVSAAGKKKSGAQDVEAPEVYQATDSALWDGRPSLGGIWVAAADVTNPERALMFNPATGKSVTGALFKRERDNPGPKLQLSSDAAEALGILAGQPTEIKVTALRKEGPAEDAAAEAVAPEDATATEGTAPAKDGDAAAIASAALDAVDAGAAKTDKKPDPSAKDVDPAAAAATGAAAVAAVAVDGETSLDAPPKKKTWKERRAEAKAAREAKKRASADAKAAAAAAAAGTAIVAGEDPTTTPDAATAAMAPIESAPLDARTPDVAKAAEKAADKPTVKAKPAAVAPAVEPAPSATPAATGPARPIQVASFSKEDNAKRAAEALAKIGVIATPQKSDKAGKAVWGVVVMGDAAMLKKIKDAGFADAYFLK